MIGAVHNCKQYGLDLMMYLYNDDLESRIEEQFKVIDGKGNEIAGNENVSCTQIDNEISKCTYHMAPDNPRMGLLFAPGSKGLKFYTTNWITENSVNKVIDD